MALALGTADRRPSEMRAEAVMSRPPRTCQAEDTVHQALATMRDARIRRLAVVDADARLVGLVSIDDLVLAAQNVRAGVGRVSFEQAMATLEAICERSTGRRASTAHRR